MKNINKFLSCLFTAFLLLAVATKLNAQIEAPNAQSVIIANSGSTDSIGYFDHVSDKLWKSTIAGTTTSYNEVNRDQWSIYLKASDKNQDVMINLWLKHVLFDGVEKYAVVKASDKVIPDESGNSSGPNNNNDDNAPAVTTNNASDISQFIAGLNYDPRILLSVTEPGSSEAVPAGGTKDRKSTGNSVIICTKNPKKLDTKMDKISILKPTTGIIYPGALIIADRNLAEGLPTPITLKRAPLTLRVDLPGLTQNGTRVINDPKNSNVQSAMNEMLEEWNAKPSSQGYVNASSSILRVEKAYSSEQLALSLGFRLDWADNSVSAATKLNTSSENEVTVAFFQQIFYTIAMNPPEKPSDVFDPSVSAADLKVVMGDAHPPAYIRSVDYGRTIMVRMETSKKTTSVDLEGALKYATAPATVINADLKFKYDQVLKNSIFTVYTVGGNAETTSLVTVGGTDLSGLQAAIQKDARYRRDNPGVPIAYTVAFLKDNTTASVKASSDYVETECIEYPNAFIKLVHNGAYVGRFNVTWQEPNQQGNLVDKAWSSGEKTAGYTYTLDLPGDAVNIKIKGEAATGLVWDPWGEAINKVLPSPTNCTYTIYGTTLGRENKVDCPNANK